METKHLEVFIDGLERYFKSVSGEDPVIEPAYIRSTESLSYYTGVIAISGKNKGSIYFTTGFDFLAQLLMCLGEENRPEYARDIVGEVANTLAGNARSAFGGEFMISVPAVLLGEQSVEFPSNRSTFIVPLVWRNSRAHLIVGLE